MKKKKPLNVAFLWHMHQPWYLWENQGSAAMPWTRLHTLKDYFDMPKIIEETGFPATVNLVPCLLEQIDLIANGKATDPYWDALLPEMRTMDEGQLNLAITHFFDVNFDRFIRSSHRYFELYSKRGNTNDWRIFDAQDFRDLQVHFLLAWFGQSLKEISEVKKLIFKDRDYAIEDKALLLVLANKRIKEIIPYYSKLWNEGKLEITFSPYYHPILPLLCDITLTRQASPLAPLPRKPFIYPADASKQIKMGQEYFSKIFNKKPTGMWPSEGSVSEEILSILVNAGVEYFFSDEDILRKSLEYSFGEPTELTPKKLYMPYRMFRGRKNLAAFFRDKRISDKIGFEYYSWNEDDAVNDFVNSLLRIGNALPDDDRDYIVSVILDGENAWEFYKDNGKPFLTKLYRALLENPDIEPVTYKDYLKKHSEIPVLDRLAPGSWINGDFSTWAGNSEKNKAWELLAETRNHYHLNADRLSSKVSEAIMKNLSIAEGSDWFWWYGDTNYTPYIDTFDALFRHHLKQVYKHLDESPSLELEKPVHNRIQSIEPVRKPLQFMSPSLEGKATTYFEWSSAGFYKIAGFRSTMQSSKGFVLQRLFYGFNLENLFMRLDSSYHLIDFLKTGGKFVLEFLAPQKMELEIFWENNSLGWNALETTDNDKQPVEPAGIEIVCDEICEMKIPFALLDADTDSPIHMVVHVCESAVMDQRFPPGEQYMKITPPDPEFEERMWFV